MSWVKEIPDVIILGDSSEDEENENENEISKNISEMNNLTEQLKTYCSSCMPDYNEDTTQWRMKLNPFRACGFLYKSKFAFKELKDVSIWNDLSDKDENYLKAYCDDEESSSNMSTQKMKENSRGQYSDVKEENYQSSASVIQNTNIDSVQEKVIQCNESMCDESQEKPLKPILEESSLGLEDLSSNSFGLDYITPLDEKSLLEIDQILMDQSECNKSVLSENNSPNKFEATMSNKDETGGFEERLPYYLENFMHILTTVIKSNDNRLFDSKELEIIEQFKDISDPAKKLYIRLYQRKRCWFRCDKIVYPNIADNLTLLFEELVDLGYMDDERSLTEFDIICNLLTASETRSLAADIKLNTKNTKNTKTELVKLLKKHCKKQRTIFMTKSSDSMSSILSKSAKKYIGKCVKLKEEQCFIFTRVILLFCLTTSHFQDTVTSNTVGTSLLYHMLQRKIGDLKYPTFSIKKKHEIFLTRQDFISYALAVELEKELEFAVEKKDFQTANTCYEKVRQKLLLILKELISQSSNKDIHCLSLPSFLSCFSKEWVIIHVANMCVDILEKEKHYSEAVSLIQLLLSQSFLCSSSRGLLWERLIIDYERHIKDINKAFLFTVEALKDPYLRTGHRFSVLQRYERLGKSPKVQVCLKEVGIAVAKEDIDIPKEETIRANIFLESSGRNRTVFSSPAVGGDYLSNVEQHVITYYQDHGFPSGKHGEGSSVTTLFFLLFWDIIFMDVTDVFQCEFQHSPLDIFCDDFYSNREDDLNERLNSIYHASEMELRTLIGNNWKKNYGTYCVCVNWGLFDNEIEIADLAICIGSKVLAGICELFCKDLRCRKGGFPDLIVWNVDTKTCKIIEVKGPGDKLASKQIVWLDVLNYLGADAFACYVTGIGGKRKRTSVE